MIVYTLEQRLNKWACDRFAEDADFGKKIIFSDEAHFDLGGYVNKQNSIHWKADAPKMSHCLVRILVHGHNWAIFLRKWAIVIGPCWTNFCPQKLTRTATFGFNRTALHATQPKLHSMFCALFFKDRNISRRADVVWPPRSSDLTPLDNYLWGAVKIKC